MHVARRAAAPLHAAPGRMLRAGASRSRYFSNAVNAFKLDHFRQRAEAAIAEGSLPSQEESGEHSDTQGQMHNHRPPKSGAMSPNDRRASLAQIQNILGHLRPDGRRDEKSRTKLRNNRKADAALKYDGIEPDRTAPSMASSTSLPAMQPASGPLREQLGVATKRRASDEFPMSIFDSIPSTRSDSEHEAHRAQASRPFGMRNSVSRQSGSATVTALDANESSPGVHFNVGSYKRYAKVRRDGLAVSRRDKQFKVFSRSWIKDHCQCSSCIQPSTSQKLHRTGDAAMANGAKTPIDLRLDDPQTLRVTGVHPGQDHPYMIPVKLLERNPLTANELFDRTHWMGADIAQTPGLRISWSDLVDDPGLYAATVQLIRYGLVVITDVPTDKTSDQECTLREVAAKFGEIRNVFYGQTWDVKSIANSKNIAYTDVDLGLHMDLCYFENPPRYQLLHCLRNKVEGGSSYFVDSYTAAEKLRQEQPDAFQALSRYSVPFHYDNDGYYYTFAHPTIRLHVSEGEVDIRAVNYSPPFQGAWLPARDGFKMDLPTAMHEFEKLLDRPEAKYEFTMREGDLVLFDNRRVLHARRAFKNKEGAETPPDGEATRWLKGCYIDGDVIRNKMRTLTRAAMNGEFAAPQHTVNEVPLLSKAQSLSA